MTGFGAYMKARREELGLTLRDVEAICGNEISNAYLSQLENGKIKKPSAHIVLMLCTAYSLSTEIALGWLKYPMRITPPKLCGECGRALPPEESRGWVIDTAEQQP